MTSGFAPGAGRVRPRHMSPGATGFHLAAWSAASFVAAAKTHGRQVRLERELAGHFSVTFGAPNPPFVEALWHRDRWVYWPAAAAFAAVAVVSMVAAARLRWPIPVVDVRGERAWWGAGIVAIVWAMNAAFLTAGLASLVRLLAVWPCGASAGAGAGAALAVPDAWAARAASGSLFWWALSLALAVSMVAFALVRRSP